MRAHPYILFLATTAFACQPADTSASAKRAIDAANAQWPRLTSTGHADSLAEFYAMDAIMMPPGMATVQGKDAIRAFFATMNTSDPRPTLTLRAEAVHGAGAMAMDGAAGTGPSLRAQNCRRVCPPWTRASTSCTGCSRTGNG